MGDYPIALRGPGSRHCKIACTTAGAGIKINSTIGGQGRNGWSGGFSIFANQVALGENSEGVLQLGGVNTVLFDVGVYNMPGIAFRFNGAQNMSCYNLNADDAGTKGPNSIGYFFDRGASGINMHSTKANYCQGGMVIFDCTDDTGPADECKNITFYGNMLERMKSYNPAIHIKTADNIVFRGGNIAHNQIDDFGAGQPNAEYTIVKIDNTNANGGETKNISFDAMEINGSTQGGSDRWATAFTVAADCSAWHHTLHVGQNITWVNVKNAFDVQSTDVLVTCDGVNKGNGNGGVGLSGGGIDKPGSVGKVNTRNTASAGTVTPRGVDRVLNITGTTTISNLTATMPGHKLALKFSSALTISTSGNIKVKSGTNIAVAANELYNFICDGTNWHLVQEGATDSLEVKGKGFVNHGSTAGTARPTGYASIEWQGTVAPTNAITGDTWIDTT